MIKNKISNFITGIIKIIQNLFIFILLSYLVFFIFENVFPGFVSNNFDLKIFFVPISILGFLSLLSFDAKENQEEQYSFLQQKLGFTMPNLKIFAIFFVVFLTGIFVYMKMQNQNYKEQKQMFLSKPYIPTIKEKEIKITDDLLRKTPIFIQNGGASANTISAVEKILNTNNLVVKKIVTAGIKYDYQDAIVRFRPEDIVVVNYLIDSIRDFYPTVEKAPLDSTTPKIILILGEP